MEFSLIWLAARCRSPDELLPTLGLERTGEQEQEPTSSICGVHLTTEWYVIVVNDYDSLVPVEGAQKLSAGREVIQVDVDERSGYVGAAAYRDGAQTWSVVHDAGREGILHLETEGLLPIEFAGVRAWHEHDQRAKGGTDADVDCIREIPLDLAKRLVGFRHDQELPGVARAHWDVLRVRPTVAKPIHIPDPIPAPPSPDPVPVPAPDPVPAPAPPAQTDGRKKPKKPKTSRLERKGWRIRRREERAKARREARLHRRGRGGLFGLLLDMLGTDVDDEAAFEDEKRQRLLARSRARRKKRRRQRREREQDDDQRP